MERAVDIRAFDDFRLGQSFAGGARPITEEDIGRFAEVGGDFHPLHRDDAAAAAQGYASKLVHGPMGLAAFFGWFYELDLARDDIVGLLDTNWRYLGPVYVGDTLAFRMTVTACRRTSSGERGILGRSVAIVNQRDEVVQAGESAVMYRCAPGARRLGQELFTADWARAVAERLNADKRFGAAMATWDGAFGLGDHGEETAFRIFRGKVIEAGVRPPNGVAFALHARGDAWARLVTGPEGLFMIEAMNGAFAVRGSAYEYLRFTKALSIVVDVIRDFAREGGAA